MWGFSVRFAIWQVMVKIRRRRKKGLKSGRGFFYAKDEIEFKQRLLAERFSSKHADYPNVVGGFDIR